jgi:hypothetical protein
VTVSSDGFGTLSATWSDSRKQHCSKRYLDLKSKLAKLLGCSVALSSELERSCSFLFCARSSAMLQLQLQLVEFFDCMQ